MANAIGQYETSGGKVEGPGTGRRYINLRRQQLFNERSTFIDQYMQLSRYIQPRRGRFLITDRDKGDRRFNFIINSKATQAHNRATAGMLAGSMSPSRPWFSLQTQDPAMMQNQAVKEWLYKVEQLLRAIFDSSNFYTMATTMIGELLLFATGCMLHVDDYNDVARYYTQTVGAYMIAMNERMEVDTLLREFEWTVRQIVQKFGYKQCSPTIKKEWDFGNYDAWFPISNFIEPNPHYNPKTRLAKHKKFRSCYYEALWTGALSGDGYANTEDNDGQFLEVSGFDEFPAYCPRWEVTGEDIYGTNCPGMTTLGDVKGLQIEEKRKAQGIDKMVNPPLKGPATLRNVNVNSLPGGLTLYDIDQNKEGLSSVYNVNPQLQELRMDISAVEKRIDDGFLMDLWLSISNMEGVQPQNQLYLTQRNEERLLQLGPALERLHGEFLSPVIRRTFAQCVRAIPTILPPPPPALMGQPLKVKYISSLAIAQRSVAVGGIDRFAAFVGQLMTTGHPQAGDKFNVDVAIDRYNEALGTPPDLVVPTDVANQARQARAQQAQEQQQNDALPKQAQALAAGTKIVKALASPSERGGTTGGNGG